MLCLTDTSLCIYTEQVGATATVILMADQITERILFTENTFFMALRLNVGHGLFILEFLDKKQRCSLVGGTPVDE